MVGSRKTHHADKVYSVLKDHGSAAQSTVAASWSRSITQFGLDPEYSRPPRRLDQTEFKDALEKTGPLVHLAQETLDRLFNSVGDAGCCVLLTNNDGVPLDRRGKACDDRDFLNLGLWTGMVWSEACEGTNGVGTGLTEARGLTIHHDEHFLTRNIGLSCTVAPIRDAQGDVVAALDVSSWRPDLTPVLTKLVAMATCEAAQKIEARYFREIFRDARVILAPDTRLGPGGLLAVDREDLVIGANYAARRAHNLTNSRLSRPFPVGDIYSPDSNGSVDDLLAAEKGVIQRALSRSQGNVSTAARLLGISRATLHRKITRLGLSN